MTDNFSEEEKARYRAAVQGISISGKKLRAAIQGVRLPDYTLADYPLDEVPDELVSLRAVADRILGLCFYRDRPEVQMLAGALLIVEVARADLNEAEKQIKEAILECVNS